MQSFNYFYYSKHSIRNIHNDELNTLYWYQNKTLKYVIAYEMKVLNKKLSNHTNRLKSKNYLPL